MSYRKLLVTGKKKIAIWGTGYIGLSTMIYFAKKGIKSVGFDVDKKKVNQINKGKLPIPELKNWFGFDIKRLARHKTIQATDVDQDHKENSLPPLNTINVTIGSWKHLLGTALNAPEAHDHAWSIPCLLWA